MFRYVATILVGILLSAPLVAGITPFPASFHTQMVPTNGTSLYVRVGGKGLAVVLLHGFGFTGDMWVPLAIVLARDHTVIVPDLRGMGMSDAFEQFGALRQDAADNKELLAKGGKITMPVFAIGAEKFFGKNMADHMQFAASNVTGGHGGESTGHHQVGYRFPRPVGLGFRQSEPKHRQRVVRIRVLPSDAPGQPHSSRLFSDHRGS
jgi:Alpha/beta hydrolase family